MKTLQSSSRGRGGRGDGRFASRFTDARFHISRRNRGGGGGAGRGSSPRDAALRDPRFAKRLKEMEKHPAESVDEEEKDVSEDEEGSDVEHSPEAVDDVLLEEADAKELAEEVDAWSASDVEFIEPRRRLAIVNCSWDHIRAVDLYAILFYALPLGGQLIDVAVYMSDFGKRMLEHERIYGPDLWVKKDEKEEITGNDGGQNNHNKKNGVEKEPIMDSDDDGDFEEDDPWQDDNVAMLQEKGEDGELFSQGKYRKYERDRMKYYYAVATFDSAETAETVYKQLDGMDVEASGVVLDLRYIDEEEVFENPVNRADRIPPNYKPLAAFKAAALSQTRFRISWDQDDVFRYRSIRDSFTGDTAEDDIAAYLAPPDSSDEDDVGDAGENKAKKNNSREKLRIRKKYASLLEEIGGLPQDDQHDDDDGSDTVSDSASDDDNSLNRFSDVEENDSDDDDENVSGDEEVMGDMEATLDLHVGTKAARLQRDAQIKQMLKSADLGSRAELKYKLRRKEMRKAKKEMLAQEREMEVTQRQDEREKKRQKLRETLGTDDAGATHMSGREKRKTHAKIVKQRLAAERVAKKKMRASNSLGVNPEVREVQRRVAGETAADTIDPRFQSKLLTDPRFHLDVAQKDKRTKPDLVDLAATVATARQVKRQYEKKNAKSDGALEYFLNRPSKKVKKE